MSAPSLSLTTKHTLRSCDVDGRGRWRLSSAQILMQELAEAHASMFDNGRAQLLEKGVVWVLARSRTQFSREMTLGEAVSVTTYPGDTARGLFPRYYEFYGESGERTGAAVTLWLLVGAVGHKLILPEKCGVIMPKTGAVAPFAHPSRIRPKGVPAETVTRVVRYSDLDVNRHMNNARYVEWLFDAADPAQMLDACVSAAQVNYLSEAKANEALTLNRFDTQSGYMVTGTAADGRAVFEGEVSL